MNEQTIQELLDEVKRQEETLTFNHFDPDTAWLLGKLLYDKAKDLNKPVTIDITVAGQQLFHVALPRTTPDNDEWIKRKNRVVNRFHKSSFRLGQELKLKGRTMEENYLVSSFEYAAHGGAFPLTIKGVGVIGTITISGLPQVEDHQMVVEGIQEYLAIYEPEWIN